MDIVTIVFTSIFIAILVVLLVYLILIIIREIKLGNNKEQNVVILDGNSYKVVSVDKKESTIEEIKPVVTPKKDDNVVIITTDQKSFKDKYVELTKEQKMYYHDLNEFIISLDGVNLYESQNRNMYKFKSIRLATIEIKKDTLVCRCNMFNADLQTYAKKEKIKAIKSAPITFKLNDEKDVEAAKYTLEIIHKNILESRNKKKDKKEEIK